MQQNLPRLILAGTNSGCGKTTVTCAVLQALVNRGISVAAAKCGPDYIDPMFQMQPYLHLQLQYPYICNPAFW